MIIPSMRPSSLLKCDINGELRKNKGLMIKVYLDPRIAEFHGFQLLLAAFQEWLTPAVDMLCYRLLRPTYQPPVGALSELWDKRWRWQNYIDGAVTTNTTTRFVYDDIVRQLRSAIQPVYDAQIDALSHCVCKRAGRNVADMLCSTTRELQNKCFANTCAMLRRMLGLKKMGVNE